MRALCKHNVLLVIYEPFLLLSEEKNSSMMPDKSEIRNDCLEIKNQDLSRAVIDIKSSTLSERRKLGIREVVTRKVTSEILIESNVNYDDLCGPWVYAKNPVYQRYVEPPTPKLCIWIYFTEEDVIYLKTYQKEKQVVLSFFGRPLHRY